MKRVSLASSESNGNADSHAQPVCSESGKSILRAVWSSSEIQETTVPGSWANNGVTLRSSAQRTR